MGDQHPLIERERGEKSKIPPPPIGSKEEDKFHFESIEKYKLKNISCVPLGRYSTLAEVRTVLLLTNKIFIPWTTDEGEQCVKEAQYKQS